MRRTTTTAAVSLMPVNFPKERQLALPSPPLPQLPLLPQSAPLPPLPQQPPLSTRCGRWTTTGLDSDTREEAQGTQLRWLMKKLFSKWI